MNKVARVYDPKEGFDEIKSMAVIMTNMYTSLHNIEFGYQNCLNMQKEDFWKLPQFARIKYELFPTLSTVTKRLGAFRAEMVRKHPEIMKDLIQAFKNTDKTVLISSLVSSLSALDYEQLEIVSQETFNHIEKILNP